MTDRTPQSFPRRFALVFGISCSAILLYLSITAIARATNSTAAIGYLMLPLAGIYYFVCFYIFGYFLGLFIRGIRYPEYRFTFLFFLSLAIVAPSVIVSTYLSIELYTTYETVHRMDQLDTIQLTQAYLNRPKNTWFGYDIFIIGEIARHPKASPRLLDEIAHLPDSRINNRLGAMIDLTPHNRKGLATIRLVALNSNVSSETLTYLSDSDNYYLLGDIAVNPRTPVDVLKKLYARSKEKYDGYLIAWGLAYNPNTPPDILRELAKQVDPQKEFDPLRNRLKENRSTPEEVRKQL